MHCILRNVKSFGHKIENLSLITSTLTNETDLVFEPYIRFVEKYNVNKDNIDNDNDHDYNNKNNNKDSKNASITGLDVFYMTGQRRANCNPGQYYLGQIRK